MNNHGGSQAKNDSLSSFRSVEELAICRNELLSGLFEWLRW